MPKLIPPAEMWAPESNNFDALRLAMALLVVWSHSFRLHLGTDDGEWVIDLVQSLRSPYRQGAVFVMNSATAAAAIRKFKTTDGQFLFQPSLTAGQPATLLG